MDLCKLSASDSGVFHGMHFGGDFKKEFKALEGEKTIRRRSTVSKICL